MEESQRFKLSVLAAFAVAFFAEFRNDGKFYFKGLHHFLAPGTWLRGSCDYLHAGFGGWLYRLERSHWNDFLLGPAIVCAIYALLFWRLRAAALDSFTVTDTKLPIATSDESVRQAHRQIRIVMNVALWWGFVQAWGEKAGYWPNAFSDDQWDFPFEFAGVAVGFWMARIFTPYADDRSDRFRSTFWIDFVGTGVVGIAYTFLVSPLVESIARHIGHSLFVVVPAALDRTEYTTLQRHVRPLELLCLAVGTQIVLNLVWRRRARAISLDLRPDRPDHSLEP
jgi:hypothetical protein